MVATWIDGSAKGRHGGPVRAGMWSAVVIGTHPIEANQEVWLELAVDDLEIGPLPAYWIENKGVNSLWHVPIPPQAVDARLHYRSGARRTNGHASETVWSHYQDALVRANLPDRTESAAVVLPVAEGLVGNRMMTARVDARGSTYDLCYPTVGLHSDVRPSEGDLPQSRSHFRGIVGGLAVGRRIDWFTERQSWEAFQHYQGATNLLQTELGWRDGPIRVLITDFAVAEAALPKTAGGTASPGQYVKRFRISNEGPEPRRTLFGVYVQAEVNGGTGETGLSWHDGERSLLAINRGHAHANRKLARDATVEFAVALDGRGDVQCEPTGPNAAILLRPLELPAGGTVTVDLLVSGAFTGWRGDPGTFEYWLKPALAWFRNVDLDLVEQATALDWDAYVEPLPVAHYPKPGYAVSLRRSALAAALHADATWGGVASSFDCGLNAYCWPREAVFVGAAFDRLGHPEVGRGVYQWLSRVRGRNRPYAFWFGKYTLDGGPEWETPAVDQTALIPWGLERHYRRTGDRDFVAACWPMIRQAAEVCAGHSGHPGLRWLDDLKLVSSAGLRGQRFGAFLYSNCAVVAGLDAAGRLADLLDKPEPAARWRGLARTVWEAGVLGVAEPGGPGLVDPESGRFLDARRVSTLQGLWTDDPARLADRSTSVDVSMLAAAVPFGLLPASDPRVLKTAEAVLRDGGVPGDPNLLSLGGLESRRSGQGPGGSRPQDASSLATLWMARYLIRLGRETGKGQHWMRALAMLDAVLARLLPLGLAMRTSTRPGDPPARAATSGAWGLHAMLIDTVLDFAGLDYDAVDRRLGLDPALPGSWPVTGLTQVLPCGEVAYRLERPVGAAVHHLRLRARLRHPVTLTVGVTCPGLRELGPWQSDPDQPPPEFAPATGRVSWSVTLPEGESQSQWTWG